MKSKKKIAIFLAARSGSKRLPKKHFLEIDKNLTVIDLCIRRLKKTKLTDKIFLCTTKRKEDYKFKAVCLNHKINLFKGDEKNVLKRFIDCAQKNSIDIIVRITADCPLIDPSIIDKCIKLHYQRKSQYTTNTLVFSYPKGLDVEVINFEALLKSQKLSKSKSNIEHVTPFIRKSRLFTKHNLKNSINYGNRRWTLDYYKDYLYLQKVIKFFSPNIFFSWKDLINAEKQYKFLKNIKKRL